ncbi:MAG: hypothetical protein DME33_00665 [Verrucomicrobia bacterium]|nr:MAG: hypothetical protein DME33_00665 [Verrucomicrobiota bacterium]
MDVQNSFLLYGKLSASRFTEGNFIRPKVEPPFLCCPKNIPSPTTTASADVTNDPIEQFLFGLLLVATTDTPYA